MGKNKNVKDKTILIIFSYLFGFLGLDRMYLGCWGTGILKLITLGGFGIWYLIDLILILINGINKNKSISICNNYKWNKKSIKYGYYISIVISVLLFLKICCGFYFKRFIKSKVQNIKHIFSNSTIFENFQTEKCKDTIKTEAGALANKKLNFYINSYIPYFENAIDNSLENCNTGNEDTYTKEEIINFINEEYANQQPDIEKKLTIDNIRLKVQNDPDKLNKLINDSLNYVNQQQRQQRQQEQVPQESEQQLLE